ncbi:MAG: hypothetical protein ACK5PS_15675, partial [Desulfopila sp.]
RKTRFLHLPPLGRKRCVLELVLHRLFCKDCGLLFWPRLQFMQDNRRYTRSFVLTVLDLLQFATIRAVADYLHVGWDMIKERLFRETSTQPSQEAQGRWHNGLCSYGPHPRF